MAMLVEQSRSSFGKKSNFPSVVHLMNPSLRSKSITWTVDLNHPEFTKTFQFGMTNFQISFYPKTISFSLTCLTALERPVNSRFSGRVLLNETLVVFEFDNFQFRSSFPNYFITKNSVMDRVEFYKNFVVEGKFQVYVIISSSDL